MSDSNDGDRGGGENGGGDRGGRDKDRGGGTAPASGSFRSMANEMRALGGGGTNPFVAGTPRRVVAPGSNPLARGGLGQRYIISERIYIHYIPLT